MVYFISWGIVIFYCLCNYLKLHDDDSKNALWGSIIAFILTTLSAYLGMRYFISILE